MSGHEDEFKCLFRPFVIDIQNHGRVNMPEYIHHKIKDAYVENDSRTFLSADLFRNQIGGLFELLKEGNSFGYLTQKDFSPTGAARTMALDVKTFFKTTLNASLIEIPDKFLPTFNK